MLRYVDVQTGEMREGHLFVAVLGASSYTYAEVTAGEQLPEWVAAHVHAYEWFGGVPRLTISDNPRTAVTVPCRYEPELNRTYLELGRHYGTVLLPARPRKPRDKAKVEAGVQVAERWILAALRNRRLFGLTEANAAVRELLVKLNRRPMRRTGLSREQGFERFDRPVLQPLPAAPYEYAQFSQATVNIDYHVVVNGNYYSVPYSLVGQHVTVRLTVNAVEILHRSCRVAAHPLFRTGKGQYATIPEHRPRSHQKHLEWTPGRLIEWATKTGPACGNVVRRILEERPHPESGYRSCLGIFRLTRAYGTERMEAACRRALATDTCSYRSLKSMLKHGIDRLPSDPQVIIPTRPPRNDTVRGPQYYR
jgi:transposase